MAFITSASACIKLGTRPFAQKPVQGCVAVDKNIQPKKKGRVSLVGTGPGDISLLTQAAIQTIKEADVILHDRLVSVDILSVASPTAEVIQVGKGRGIGTGSQPSIDALMESYCIEGKEVVRLKGGDPAIFGRLGDEVGHLHAANIPVQVVPGVTTASAVAATLGFPLTSRGIADSVCFVTAHEGPPSWLSPQLLDCTTIVVYMGLKQIEAVLRSVNPDGRNDDVAAVAVESATLETQNVAWGTLSNIAKSVIAGGFKSPTLFVLGDVVRSAPEWPSAS